MTDQTKRTTPGKLFVVYLSFGLSLLVISIFAGRALIAQSQAQKIFLTSAILAVNLITVILYTAAILRDRRLKADQDAPDMAYYLGFSLTVGALALSFLGDLVSSQSSGTGVDGAIASANLVSNALGQFGAGLLATLFGLCAKIYLGSQQSQEFSDPDALYQQFRSEISSFRQTLDSAALDLASGVQASCETIRASGEVAAIAMNSLAKELSEAQLRISTEANPGRISSSVQEFIEELEKLKKPTTSLTSDVTLLCTSLNQTQAAFGEMLNSAKELSTQFASNLQISQAHDSALKQSTLAVEMLVEQQHSLHEELLSVHKLMAKLGKGVSELAQNLPQVTTNLSQVGLQAAPLSQGLGEMTSALVGPLKQFGAINSSLSELAEKVQLLKEATAELTEMNSKGGISARSFHTSIEALESRVSSATNTFERLMTTFDNEQAQALQMSQNLVNLTISLKGVTDEISRLQESTNLSSSALGALGNQAESVTTSLRAAPERLNAIQGPLEATTRSTEQLSEALVQLASQANESSRTLQELTVPDRS